MTRRLKRLREFELTLQIKDDQFIRPPTEGQRTWLLNRLMNETTEELQHLDAVARRFVPGGAASEPVGDRTQAVLSETQIMEDWQIPLMRAMAAIVAETHGEVLEIGFGRGVSADFIQAEGVRSHTIVEVNDAIVAELFQPWRAGYADRDIRLIHGKWQETIHQFGRYDGIFFHTYPLTEAEFVAEAVNSVTFAAHFFPTAAAHLKEGGIFTYLTHEIDSFSRAHQRLVLHYFREFTLRPVPLSLPPDLKDAWWADSMMVVKAVK